MSHGVMQCAECRATHPLAVCSSCTPLTDAMSKKNKQGEECDCGSKVQRIDARVMERHPVGPSHEVVSGRQKFGHGVRSIVEDAERRASRPTPPGVFPPMGTHPSVGVATVDGKATCPKCPESVESRATYARVPEHAAPIAIGLVVGPCACGNAEPHPLRVSLCGPVEAPTPAESAIFERGGYVPCEAIDAAMKAHAEAFCRQFYRDIGGVVADRAVAASEATGDEVPWRPTCSHVPPGMTGLCHACRPPRCVATSCGCGWKGATGAELLAHAQEAHGLHAKSLREMERITPPPAPVVDPCPPAPAAMLGEAEGLAERIAILCGRVVVAEANAGHSLTDVYGHAADVGGLARQIARSLRAAQREAEAREGGR